MPHEAVELLFDDPRFLGQRIMSLRSYARTKKAIDEAKDENEMPKGPVADLVWEIHHEIVRRKRGERSGNN